MPRLRPPKPRCRLAKAGRLEVGWVESSGDAAAFHSPSKGCAAPSDECDRLDGAVGADERSAVCASAPLVTPDAELKLEFIPEGAACEPGPSGEGALGLEPCIPDAVSASCGALVACGDGSTGGGPRRDAPTCCPKPIPGRGACGTPEKEGGAGPEMEQSVVCTCEASSAAASSGGSVVDPTVCSVCMTGEGGVLGALDAAGAPDCAGIHAFSPDPEPEAYNPAAPHAPGEAPGTPVGA